MFLRRRFSAQPLATLDASTLPWRSEGMLVLVQGGSGALNWASGGTSPTGQYCRTLLLRDVPLLHAQMAYNEGWCPTCEKLLALGAGRDIVGASALNTLRQVSNETVRPVASVLEAMKPLLRLLRDGVYLVSRVRHYPTNGQGSPFWALDRGLRRLEASRDWYFSELGLFRHAPGFPAYLLPTQALAGCDWEAVDSYRRRIREGERVGALAYWADGFLSGLLDGHHRATAALLEGVPIDCLTLMDAGSVEYTDNARFLWLWDARIGFQSLPRAAVRLLEKQAQPSSPAQVDSISAPQERSGRAWETHPRWPELATAAAPFPRALALAALEIVEDTSDETVEGLLANGERGAPELWLTLQAMIASHDPRAARLAVRIGRGHWPELWEVAFRFLATQRTSEVEDFFVDFLVRDEGKYPWLTRIADGYFSEERR